MVALSVYGIALIFGSLLMIEGVVCAPVGYEDEHGFHHLPDGDTAY